MSYPFNDLWVNGRLVFLESILRETIEPATPFEDHLFMFIREWLHGRKTFLLQTSGSTGAPKGITITREQMEASAMLSEQALSLKKNTHALICIDIRYIGGTMMLVRSLMTGMRIWAIDPVANPLVKIPVDQCVNFAAFVPLQVQSILGSKHPHLLNNLDTAIIGGAPLDAGVIDQLDHFHCRCYATYGMTETLSHIALRPLNGKDKRPYFQVLPGISVALDDRGCLMIDAPYLPERVITNDLAEFISPDRFIWLGRWDNVINSGGVKIVPEKIEAALETVFADAGVNNRFFIHGVEDKTLGQKVVLVIEATGNTGELLDKVVKEITIALLPYEVPKEIRVVPFFITTANGKINRVKTLGNVQTSLTVKK